MVHKPYWNKLILRHPGCDDITDDADCVSITSTQGDPTVSDVLINVPLISRDDFTNVSFESINVYKNESSYELITDGEFSDSSNWVTNGTAQITDGQAILTGNGTWDNRIQQQHTETQTSGNSYILKYDIVSNTLEGEDDLNLAGGGARYVLNGLELEASNEAVTYEQEFLSHREALIEKLKKHNQNED